MEVADAQQAPGSLGRRVQQTVRQGLDSDEARAALAAVAAAGAAGAAAAAAAAERGWDVRAAMAGRRRQADADFGRALGLVDAAFGDVEAGVARLGGECAALRARVDAALRATAGAAAAAALLGDERREAAARARVADGVLARFALGDGDAARLAAAGAPDDAFFAALDRAAQARAECRAAGAGAELQRALAAHEEAAYGALLRWVQAEARALARPGAPEFSAQLKRALGRLRPHAALFDAAAAEIARVRCGALGRAFAAALAHGGGGARRPIEAHAADPQRYVGDMLAWAHQACASERELLDTLFSDDEAGADVSAAAAAKPRLLAAALEGIARPLELRVQQTLDALAAPRDVHRIDALLDLYCALFAAACPPDAPFLAAVARLAAAARARLAARLAALADAAAADLDAGPASPALDAPPALHALLDAVRDVLRLHQDAPPATAADPPGPARPPLVDCVAAALDIVCAAAPAAVARCPLRPYEQSMLLLNVLAAMQAAAAPFADDLPRWLARCAADERRLADALAAQLLAILKDRSHLPFAAADPAAAPDLPARCARFSAALAADLDPARLAARLHSHALARSVAAQVSHAFVADYAALHARLAAAAAAATASLLPPETLASLLP
ncbi:hypothetical protein H4R18_001178 [Coemansia javaensis]|uniref:Conserved Oligomeric Golgi complex subunit 6 C-terminal domain-containing protein n=1 Tax=Coemansia javaensis TaxID=2761396 RepID=A0A9W8HIZ2_9FUNG|nr:hypothetical protein H4R18_001178 [Coemansia javaensis]